MSGKRKRSKLERSNKAVKKRRRIAGSRSSNEGLVRYSVLSQYYLKVLTLREYLLSKLPPSSRVRRKKIMSISCNYQNPRVSDSKVDDCSLAQHLDLTLVGILEENALPKDDCLKQRNSFSQLADTSDTTIRSGVGDGGWSQSEIVDFTIWQQFNKNPRSVSRIKHLLCQGFRKDVNFQSINRDENPTSGIPGLVSVYPNNHVTAMKGSPWPQVLALMGIEGQNVMTDLILDCGIYLAVDSGHGNYYQLSGTPIGDLQVLQKGDLCAFPDLNCSATNCPIPATVSRERLPPKSINTPAGIVFVRNRMFYARAALNTRGCVRFGLRHIHVLNRHPYRPRESARKSSQHPRQLTDKKPNESCEGYHGSTIYVMMYIFPREFGLHNVFTASVDPRETVQAFKDYTLREDDITSRYSIKSANGITNKRILPKRLRGDAIDLVQKLQILHSRCPYRKLLNYYCPFPGPCTTDSVMLTQQTVSDASTAFVTQAPVPIPNTTATSTATTVSNLKLPTRKPSLMDCATPKAQVSAFCRAVLSEMIPNEFWGVGDVQAHNKRLFLTTVDRFIMLRRFESLSLHDAVQKMKIRGIPWLATPNTTNSNMSQSDNCKRMSLFHEFVYYLIDSMLIPLIRAHFYVTESNVHRYHIFFFRHDVWRSLSEPELTSLKLTMFEEVKSWDVQQILNSRTIGFSQVRLLPKEMGVRPIMNLKRRMVKKGYKKMLGSSINSLLAPVYNMFTYEKNSNPERLGSAIFSVGDLYNKLKAFHSRLSSSRKRLFFVKVDVQSAFDTIPQSAVLKLMASLPQESEYRISKHAEIKPGDGHRLNVDGHGRSRPIRKWTSLAASPGDFQSFSEKVETTLAVGKKNTIFVENVVSQFHDRDDLLGLLAEHVQRNMVKIGKRFYRQKKGIPQGSVLSSLLCNYFYADLESHHFSFLESRESLLLRLVDDFLLITTNRQHAKMFLQIMHDGLLEYGVSISPAKTLANFEASVNGLKVPRLVGSRNFPYCGTFIDTKTLYVTRDRQRRKDTAIVDSLTVQFSKNPGKMFHHKILNAFKIQAHAIFLDTSFNSVTTVFSNIYDNFIETATKMWRYAKCLQPQKQPPAKLVIRTIMDLVDLAFVLLKSKGKNKKNEGYRCAVSKVQVEWLALRAFQSVLRRKQSKYRDVIAWLDGRVTVLIAKRQKECRRLMELISASSMAL